MLSLSALLRLLAAAAIAPLAGPLSIVHNYAAEATYIGRVKADGTIGVLQQSGEVEPQLSCRKK